MTVNDIQENVKAEAFERTLEAQDTWNLTNCPTIRVRVAATCCIAQLFILLLVGCDRQSQTPPEAGGAKPPPRRSNYASIPDEQYHRILAQCLRDISYAKEFAQIFTNRYAHIIGGDPGPGFYTLTMQAQLYGRYLVFMKIPITLDKEKNQLLGHGDPWWVVFGVLVIKKLPSGTFQITPDGRSRHYLTPEQWQKLVAAGGDLSVLGLEVLKDKPLRWFEEFWGKQEDALPMF